MTGNSPSKLINAKRVVIKIGSSSLNHSGGGISREALAGFVDQVASLKKLGCEIVIVSSGAVAAGMGIMGLTARPGTISLKQAAAAVGQGYLIQHYNEELGRHDLIGAQILLTRMDLADKERYANARNTLESLLQNGVVPIVNENDTVAVEELCFGDNDRLSALVAGLVDAQMLVLLSDVDGLYTGNPRTDPQAKLISNVPEITLEIEQSAVGKGSQIGTGGMSTKLLAAKMVTRFGIGMLILNGARPDQFAKYIRGEKVGTYFEPSKKRVPSRKRWLAWGGISEGTIIIDDGAKAAILWEGKSLLPKGVVKIDGTWERGTLVRVTDKTHEEIARGLASLSSTELEACKGMHSETAATLIGEDKGCEVIHRDNLTITR